MKKPQIFLTGLSLILMSAPLCVQAVAAPPEPTPTPAAVVSTQQMQPYAQTATTVTPTQQTAKPATTAKPELPKFAPGQEPFSMEIAVPKPAGARQFNLEVAPGASAEDAVVIKNFSDHELHFSLYAADPTVTNTGSAAYKTRGETTSKGPGAWVKFEEAEVDLPSNTARRVKFMVTVPADAAPGDYRAGIAMEKSAKDINNPGITINARFIIQANIKVKGAVAGSVSTADGSASANQDGWRVYYYAGAIILFVASVGLLAWMIINDKRKKKVAPVKKVKPAAPARVVKKAKTKKAKK